MSLEKSSLHNQQKEYQMVASLNSALLDSKQAIKALWNEEYNSTTQKLKSSCKMLIWTTATELSVLIGDTYYRREISREELIRLAEHFLSKALERAPE